MLSASRELGVIKRIRKRSFKAFDPLEDKEESKEYRQKRGKFREENNVKITDWLIQKSPKKNKTDKIDKKWKKRSWIKRGWKYEYWYG